MKSLIICHSFSAKANIKSKIKDVKFRSSSTDLSDVGSSKKKHSWTKTYHSQIAISQIKWYIFFYLNSSFITFSSPSRRSECSHLEPSWSSGQGSYRSPQVRCTEVRCTGTRLHRLGPQLDRTVTGFAISLWQWITIVSPCACFRIPVKVKVLGSTCPWFVQGIPLHWL